MSEPARRNLGAGAFLATTAQIVNALVGGVTGILVARLLGPDGTAGFNLLLTAVLLLAAVATVGIDTGASYHVSGRRWHASDALRQCQLGALALGLAGAAVGALVAAVTSGSAFEDIDPLDIAIALAALPAALSWTFVAAIALAGERYLAYAIAISSQGVALLVLAAILTPLFDLTGAVIALTASNFVAAAGLLGWGLRSYPSVEPGWPRRSTGALRAASAFGVRAYLTNVLSYFNQRADLFVLNASAATAAVGHYSIALSLTTLGMLLPRALSAVAMPRVASLDAGGVGEEKATVAASARHAVVLVALSSAVLAVGIPAVPLVYGGDFGPAVKLAYILLPGVALFGLGSVLAATIVGKGRPEYSLYTALIVTPPTLLLYLVLVPRLGGEGAALASALSYSATFALLLLYFRRVTGIAGFRELLPGRGELRDYQRLARQAGARLGR